MVFSSVANADPVIVTIPNPIRLAPSGQRSHSAELSLT
jgi:hypothetical protein